MNNKSLSQLRDERDARLRQEGRAAERVEIERLQARLREVEAERDEAHRRAAAAMGHAPNVFSTAASAVGQLAYCFRSRGTSLQTVIEKHEATERERDEARAELKRTKDVACTALDKKMVRKTPLHLRGQRYAVALRRIADGEV